MKEEKTALIVIDMQAAYIGEKSRNKDHTCDLIDRINEKIAVFQKLGRPVIYVKNVSRRKKEPYISDFAYGLSIVSENIALKRETSIFSNAEFLNLLYQKHISRLEIVGIGGNCCVARAAIDAAEYGFSVIIPIKYVGIKDQERFVNTRKKTSRSERDHKGMT